MEIVVSLYQLKLTVTVKASPFLGLFNQYFQQNMNFQIILGSVCVFLTF